MRFNYYKITNIINNKFYIGITEKETEERIKQHFRKLHSNTHSNYKLQNDFNYMERVISNGKQQKLYSSILLKKDITMNMN